MKTRRKVLVVVIMHKMSALTYIKLYNIENNNFNPMEMLSWCEKIIAWDRLIIN